MLTHHRNGLLSSSFSLIIDSSVGLWVGIQSAATYKYLYSWYYRYARRWRYHCIALRPGACVLRRNWCDWLSNCINVFVVINFDALAQASDIRIERWQVAFLCWMQDSNLEVPRHLFASRLNAHSQTDWTIEDQAKTWTQQPVPMMSEHSANLTSLPFGFRTWLLLYTCLLLLISMLWHRKAIFESKGDKLSSSAECRIPTWKSQDTYSPADRMPTHKPTELSRIKLKHELNSPSLWWVSIQPTWLHCRLAFAPGSCYIHVCYC